MFCQWLALVYFGSLIEGFIEDKGREEGIVKKETRLCLAGIFLKRAKTRTLCGCCGVPGHLAKQMALTDRMV